MKCEVCGAPSDLHVTEVDEHGAATERHFCRVHASSVGVTMPSERQLAESRLPELRGLVEFMRTHERMPSRAEQLEQGLTPFVAESRIEPGSEEFRRLLAHLEEVVAFIEANGRLPTGGEIPGVP